MRILKILKNINPTDFLLVVLFFICFEKAVFYIWNTFTTPPFIENGIGFILITFIYIFLLFKKKPFANPDTKSPFILLITILSLSIINSLFLKLSLLPAVLFFAGLYALTGFYIEKKFWRQSIFIFLILILTLPLLERVQKFFGFPIRMLTAEIVSFILKITGIGNISKAAVIVTENHSTSIDLPCSGVKSIYTGSLFMLAVYYLQRIKLSFRIFPITVAFFGLLLFFNTWRVFSLIYIVDVLEMKTFGNSIHLLLGLTGFSISCWTLWFLTSKYSNHLDQTKNLLSIKKDRINFKIISLGIIICVIILNTFFIKQTTVIKKPQIQREFILENINLSPQEFSGLEKSYFENNDVEFSKKYTGLIDGNIPFSLIVIASKSARTHHDPETCLQALGYKINDSEILQLNDFKIRRLNLDNGGQVLYWFAGKDKSLLDYSQRVWEEVINPNRSWTLVMIGFTQKFDIKTANIKELLIKLNFEAKNII